jgi:hypothetical protein
MDKKLIGRRNIRTAEYTKVLFAPNASAVIEHLNLSIGDGGIPPQDRQAAAIARSYV